MPPFAAVEGMDMEVAVADPPLLLDAVEEGDCVVMGTTCASAKYVVSNSTNIESSCADESILRCCGNASMTEEDNKGNNWRWIGLTLFKGKESNESLVSSHTARDEEIGDGKNLNAFSN
jgi:hypothetical protein